MACTVGATAVLVALTPPALAQQADPVLDRPLNGEAAVTALGGDLHEVAQRNRRSAAELTAALREDRTLWLDTGGRLFVKDDVPPAAPAEAAADQGPFPDDATFRLNSRPGAQHTLFLDFDGHVVSGTRWNDLGVSTERQPAWDLDGNPLSWSRTEHDTIQSVYLRVAEDFSPFDVNVTTQDPGDSALRRTATSDELYGSRVLFSPASATQNSICPSGCGGVAYLGTFNRVNGEVLQPARVFSHRLGNGAKTMAEAASHEAGHNLGLDHDGTSTSAYYYGHGDWAPIMGVGYTQPLVQWSRGEYPRADNQQDDLATMQTYGAPLRADDHGSTIAAARQLGTATSAAGVLETSPDRDVFAIPRDCTDQLRVHVDPAAVSPNADLRLRLLDGAGRVLGEDDPAPRRLDSDTLAGLSAVATVTTGPGTYYAEVGGVGAGDLATGSSDYGSLGGYTLGVGGCRTATAPATPTSVATSKDPATRSATLGWTPPTSDGGSPITGYRVSRDGTDDGGGGPWSTVLPASARSQTVTQLVLGQTYGLSVQAINDVGTGPAATVPTTLTDAPVGSTFLPLLPVRVLDTRTRIGAPAAEVGAGGTVRLQVTGPDGSGLAPVGSTAVALNVTATDPSVTGYVSVYPSGAVDGPASSNLNVTAGQTVPNLVVSRVAADGSVTLYNHAGTVALVADLQGAYVPDSRGATYRPLDPQRVLDTCTGQGAPRARVGAGGTLNVQVTGPLGSGLAPLGSTAVVLNVTATNPAETGYVSVYASDLSSRPTSSNLNVAAGQTVPNLVITQVGPDGRVVLYNANGSVDLLADLQGAYVPDAGGHGYVAANPSRVLDTRDGLGAPAGKVGPSGTLVLQVTGPPGSGLAPEGSTAVVLNVTATGPTSESYVSVYPSGFSGGPNSSKLNLVTGQTVPNLVVARVGSGGTVTLNNHAGSVHLIADLQGSYDGGARPLMVTGLRAGSGASSTGPPRTRSSGAASG